MKKIIFSIVICLFIPLGILSGPVLVRGEYATSVQELIQKLQQQIEQLKNQINLLKTQAETVKQIGQEIKGTLSLVKELKPGMSGDNVKLLQELLATDPDIYPEGLVTGYFGNLTKNAVKRFQKIAGLEEVGEVGPKTLSKINELLTAGAGNSGKVPPGLLIAPGIRKKVDLELLKPLPGQILPPGIAKKISGLFGEDVTPPVITEVKVSSITQTSAKISWVTNENADSKVWYGTLTPLTATSTTLLVSSTDLVLNHEITLSAELSPIASQHL